MKQVLIVDGLHAGQVVFASCGVVNSGCVELIEEPSCGIYHGEEVVLLDVLSPRRYKIKTVIDASGQRRHVGCFGDPTEAEIMRAIKVAISETKLPRVTQ